MPLDEPGEESDVRRNGKKWVRGLRWENIDEDRVLRHVTSRGTAVEIDLKPLKMVMDELPIIGGARRTGPLIVYEKSGWPDDTHQFRRKWRQVADAAGVPKEVKNMDSARGATRSTLTRPPTEAASVIPSEA